MLVIFCPSDLKFTNKAFEIRLMWPVWLLLVILDLLGLVSRYFLFTWGGHLLYFLRDPIRTYFKAKYPHV
jgi:hypothetical protein